MHNSPEDLETNLQDHCKWSQRFGYKSLGPLLMVLKVCIQIFATIANFLTKSLIFIVKSLSFNAKAVYLRLFIKN